MQVCMYYHHVSIYTIKPVSKQSTLCPFLTSKIVRAVVVSVTDMPSISLPSHTTLTTARTPPSPTQRNRECGAPAAGRGRPFSLSSRFTSFAPFAFRPTDRCSFTKRT